MHHAERLGGPVAAAQKCAIYNPLSVVVRGRRGAVNLTKAGRS